MSDEERLIADALNICFKKNAKIPSDLYTKMTYELKVDDCEVVKVNMILKRGLVIDIEEDSFFRCFLNLGDILIQVNDKVVQKTDFKLNEMFKGKGCKNFHFTYIRMRSITDEPPPLAEGDRRDGFEYRVAAMYFLQRISVGIIMQSYEDRVYVMEIAPKSVGAMTLKLGDVILHVNGKRQTDPEKTLAALVDEFELKGYAKITIERASSEVCKATVSYIITKKENRDPPVPPDCAEYISGALSALKSGDPKSIMRNPRKGTTDDGNSVGFHDRITTESIIPSDIADEALTKTPARVPGQPQQSSPAAAPPAPAPAPSPPTPPAAAAAPAAASASASPVTPDIGDPASPHKISAARKTRAIGTAKKQSPSAEKARKRISGDIVQFAKSLGRRSGGESKGSKKKKSKKENEANNKTVTDCDNTSTQM